MPALFYAKAGSLYVSDPAGTPGRKLTDGPADTQPAPSPDGTRVAYVHKNSTSDYGGDPESAAGLQAATISTTRYATIGAAERRQALHPTLSVPGGCA
ncbi:hypothetical protein OSI87_19445, partial [Mycobacterium ulcerans]